VKAIGTGGIGDAAVAASPQRFLDLRDDPRSQVISTK